MKNMLYRASHALKGLPNIIQRVRLKRVAVLTNKMTGKIDDAINVISFNGTIIQTLNEHAADKYLHGVQLVQTNFSFASKIMLLSRIVAGLFSNDDQAKANVAIYSSLLVLVIFLSDIV